MFFALILYNSAIIIAKLYILHKFSIRNHSVTNNPYICNPK